MTIGWYAVAPPKRVGYKTFDPYPYCRACAEQPGMTKVVPIDERANVSIKCRGCKARLKDWK
jgi:hypothetical protein